jgi:hypothetical protein
VANLSRAAICLSISVCMASVACSATELGNELVVELKTDFVPEYEFHSIRTVITPELEVDQPPIVTETAASRSHPYLTGVRIGEYQQLTLSQVTVQVSLLNQAGKVVVARPTRVTLTKRFGLTVLITRDCQDVQCPLPDGDPNLTACLGGQCVDPLCHPGAPEYCGSEFQSAGCYLASDCISVHACVRAQCLQKQCEFTPDDVLCGPSQTCSLDLGCEGFIEQSCVDGERNLLETDIDCGGPACPPCTGGQWCLVDTDCDPGPCENKICAMVAEIPDPPSPT